jgi:hypothetical protein
MNWASQDNKKYRGKIDRIFVSLGEEWEVDYYVGQYLKTRNYADTHSNREVVHKEMEMIAARPPILRTEMDRWLDSRLTRT